MLGLVTPAIVETGKGAVRSGMGSGQAMTADDAEAISRELGHLV